jgi:hypothetical protein
VSDRTLFRKTLDGFVPANDDGQDFYARVKTGELVELKGVKVRNGQYHRLFFAMLKLISENSNPHISEAAALHFAKLATGTGEFVTDTLGRRHFIPGSISFAKMDQHSFKDFVQTAIPPLVGRFMAGSAADDVIAEAMALAA